jgi:hypothetical protein
MYHFFEMFWSFEEHDFRDILLAKTLMDAACTASAWPVAYIVVCLVDSYHEPVLQEMR